MNLKKQVRLLVILVTSAIFELSGCGGNNSGSGGSTTLPPPSSTITSIAVSCTLNAVPVGQSSQCNPNVRGTGNFSQTVSWLVSGVPGGNSSVGTITSSGLYTAPNGVPSPYTVNVTATSVQDGTKSAFTPVIVVGTIATTSQTVTASDGGKIVLPDGSSVTIPANLLNANQTVVVSEASAPLNSSPSILSVGPQLTLALSSPISSTVGTQPMRLAHKLDDQSTTSIQFVVTIGANANSTLQGAAPMANLTTSSGQQILFPTGSYDQTNQVATIYLDSTYLSGVEEMNVTMANFDSSIPLAPAKSWELYWDDNGKSFQTLSQGGSCPLPASLQSKDSNILILVHGMFSSVEGAFANSTAAMKAAGGYSLVLGFDYDWTQRVADSGKELADFINSLVGCQGIQRIDVEAHSEGVAVTLSSPGLPNSPEVAGTQLSSQAISLIKNVISLAGPIKGTPLADSPQYFVACYYYEHPLLFVALPWIPPNAATNLAGVLGEIPPFQDLTSSGDPLSQFRQSFEATLPYIQFVAAGGNLPSCGPILDPLMEFLVFDGHPFDGIMPLDSALGFNSGIPQLHPLPPFADDHSYLHDDPIVINDVGKQVLPGPQLTLTCGGSQPCEATQQQPFDFLLALSTSSLDFNAVEVYMQDSSGQVTLQTPNFSYAESGIVWALSPPCSKPPCSFSFFSFLPDKASATDQANTLASNGVMGIVEPGSGTAGIAFSPTRLDFGSVEIGSSATQSVTITSTGAVDLQITQLSLTNNPGTFSDSSQCGTTLTVGANCSISITFTPTHALSQSATVNITDNAPGSPQSVPLSGTGISSSQLPTVTTGSASAVTSTGATTGGTVNPNGSDTQVWFQYSTNSTMSGASSTPQQDVGAGTTAVPISANLFPLNSSTTYYFQVMASNSAGTSSGTILSFTTTSSAQAPTISFISPNPVPIGSAETVLISGSGFQTGGTLHFSWTVGGGGSDNRTDYTFVDSGDLLITINTGTTASTGWTVQMTNAAGPPSNVFPFSVQ